MKTNYEAALLSALLDDDLEAVCEIISHELEGLTNITDESYNLIAQFPKKRINEAIWDSYLIEKTLPADLIKLLNEKNLIEQGLFSDKPFVTTLDTAKDYNRIITRIMMSQKIYGYLTVYIKTDVTDEDIEKLGLAAKVIAYQMYKKEDTNNYIGDIYELFISNLFNQNIHSEKDLTEWQKAMPVPLRKPYRIICAGEKNHFNYAYMNTVLKKIKNQYHYLSCTIYQDQLYLLVDKVEEKGQMQLMDEMIELLKSYDLNIGISNDFSELLLAELYRQQASLTALLQRKDSLYFMDEALQLMNEEIKDKQELYIHPAIKILSAFDQKNSTEYLKTLFSYLRLFAHHVAIENELKIHRNTVYNRIRTIEELCGIDLSDAYTFTHLYLSYLMSDDCDK